MVSTSHLLVVEPSESVRLFLSKKLSELSNAYWEIIFCNNASQAINTCQKIEFKLIICNLTLPDMEGQELISLIRNTEKNKNTIICATSGNQQFSAINEESQTQDKILYFEKSDGFESLINFIHQQNSTAEKTKPNITLISHSQTLVSILSQSILAKEYHFSHYELSDQIIESLKNQQKPAIDLILVQHTEIDHELFSQFLNSIRSDLGISPEELPIMAILAETTEFDGKNYVQLFSLGINDFMHQPLNIETLLDKINTLIEVTRQNLILYQL